MLSVTNKPFVLSVIMLNVEAPLELLANEVVKKNRLQQTQYYITKLFKKI
jgi:hypothetical protein